ncbi:Uncharacterised protein [Mycobacteroides abscessus subsp. massiliense]|uniref:hypothetical protein n=1 Tax=Mycobacteroides abscessus TaxID=36809 RepID=UPI0002D66895|nr:hypothetical protein [Mycobacteroides abscessus]AMU76494.1 hypothetical protein A3O06_19485 [Mycobacteroides abscessus]ANO00220.1 hypothetical protein BAB74_16980 [Mycobacteroides abscessus]ANO25440.1 hypothetical protein BAB79_19480 [Mycobacteroides abscessus]SLF10797.1 Uncharacterised protein [Mycobacteroides abscessus subsp. massiliense]SLG78994.1 Uncharacterised protein [Mycobacteroides abscessus subsp. massiliense]
MVDITRFSAAQMAEINGKIKPRLSDLYEQSSSLLSKRGHGIVDRAIKKGTVGGDVGMQLLFEPAMLLSLVATQDVLYDLAVVAKDIPFIGNYGLWSPCEATIAATYRHLMISGDPRAADVELWLSLPENDGRPGPPVIHQAMTNRLNGLLVEQIRSDVYAPPLKLPQFSYVIAKLRELSVMWAFGGSEAWPRPRIDEQIAGIHQQQVADFLA